MSITRDDAGTISNLHGVRSTTRNYRDASGTAGGRCVAHLTPIHRICQLSAFRQLAEPPNADYASWSSKCVQAFSCARLLKERLLFLQGQNPFGGGRLRSNDGKDASGPSSQRAPKRQKTERNSSKYFVKPSSEPRTRSQRAQVVLSSSPPRRSRTADPIVIDEDDTSDIDDSPSKHPTLKTSSPDPMDIITHPPAYTFDASKPSPIHQFSSSLEELPRSPTDGESTARLRKMKQTEAQYSPSRPYGDLQSAKALVIPRIAPSGRADGSPGKGRVKKLASIFESHTPRSIDLKARTKQYRKNAMKPKQVSLFAPHSGVPQLSELRAPAAGCAVTHEAARSARYSAVWLRWWLGALKGQIDSERCRLPFTLGGMVYRSGHPSARGNTRAPGPSHMGAGSPQSATRGLFNTLRVIPR